MRNYRRALRTQARIALQELEQHLTDSSLTQTELEKRRKEVKAGGALQKKLINAADGLKEKVQEQQDEDVDPAQDADDYENDDLRDARDRDNENQDDSVNVNNFSIQSREDATEPGPDTQPDVPAACETLMNVLVGQEDIEKPDLPCRLCEADETVPDNKKSKTYKPGALSQHQGTGFHTPKSRFLRKHKEKKPCPYGCGKKVTGTELLQHVWKDVKQSDEHLLAAAKDGLFARDFDPAESRQSHVMTRMVGGKATQLEAGDPDTVPSNVVVRERNIEPVSGNINPREVAAGSKEKPVLRLPTAQPLTDSSWWKQHEEGLYGVAADTLQKQRTWIAEQLDSNLRALNYGRADESGTTRTISRQNARKIKGLATLRKRLREELKWTWAEDVDNNELPEDDEAEGEERQGQEDEDNSGEDDDDFVADDGEED